VPFGRLDVPILTTTTLGTYVPPHLRNVNRTEENNSEAIQKLSRQLKGLLNRYYSLAQLVCTVLTSSVRMSEQNISTIISSVEELYRGHRRNGNDILSLLACSKLNRRNRCHFNANYFDYQWYIQPFVSSGLFCRPLRCFRLQLAQTCWYRVWYVPKYGIPNH